MTIGSASNPPEIGPALREQRKHRGWTLDRLADESGVSRSMLSEIERGDANPTFATLWSVTRALGVEIQDLTTSGDGGSDPAINITTAELTPTMSSPDGLVTIRALSPVQTADSFEWYEVCFEPNGSLRSAPHASGTDEHLSVLAGELRVTCGDVVETVGPLATARYRADVHHEITNRDNSRPARALLVVIGAGR